MQTPSGQRLGRGFAAVVVVGVVLGVTGCGRAVPTSQGGPATVRADHSSIGAYLIDEQGHALYLFERDEKGESYCSGACESVWPPYETSGNPTAGAGVSQRLLGVVTRDDGGRQVTYAGEPLYYYAGDASEPDETYGEGIKQFGSEWYLVSAKNGAPVESQGDSEGSS